MWSVGPMRRRKIKKWEPRGDTSKTKVGLGVRPLKIIGGTHHRTHESI